MTLSGSENDPGNALRNARKTVMLWSCVVTEEASKEGRGVGWISGRNASWLARSACAFSLALTGVSVLLIVLLIRSDTPIYYYWLETSMVAAGYSTVGAIVAARLPDSPIGWLFCAIGLCFAVVHFSAEYASYALLLTPSRSLPGDEVFAWLNSWMWVGQVRLRPLDDPIVPGRPRRSRRLRPCRRKLRHRRP